MVFDAGQHRPWDPVGGRTSPSSIRFSQDLEQSNYEREQYTGTIRSMRTSHCRWNRISSTSESKKLAPDQQSIRRAKGLLDRALDEMVDFREMHEFHTPSGRCWHVTPECPTLANSQRIDERAACSVCFNTHMTSFKNHQNTGTTFDEDCRQFFRRHGGRVGYMHTINS